VHFALTALERGATVAMIDVGYPAPDPALPDVDFNGLKERLDDPAAYFLGERGEGVVYPGDAASYYGHPPTKDYVFRTPTGFSPELSGMQPVFSFARGGLAGAWTAGSYVWTDDDLERFPFDHTALQPHYDTVARRIGVTGAPDDLEPFLPLDYSSQPPAALDEHSSLLMDRYATRRAGLTGSGFFLGRSRVATLTQPLGTRPACSNLGRCLWGCPTRSLYHPAVTLAQCLEHDGFSYHPGRYVTHVELDERGRVTGVGANEVPGGGATRFEGDTVVLAAGALNSSKIYLESLFRQRGERVTLGGLMDNRQVHVPFLTPAMIGQDVSPASYQFHHLAFGLVRPEAREYVHGQITTLKAASIHPILLGLPVGYRMALAVLQTLRAGLGVANVNFHDERREESHVTLVPDDGPTGHRLVINYVEAPGSARRQDAAVTEVKRALRALGSVVPPGMSRILPMGTSAHYAGTLPMTHREDEHTCTPEGRVRGFDNLYVVDGAGFPFLPAKNLTLSLMANATRIADTL
jgi:choline dehydrogenase-like flavoprotein